MATTSLDQRLINARKTPINPGIEQNWRQPVVPKDLPKEMDPENSKEKTEIDAAKRKRQYQLRIFEKELQNCREAINSSDKNGEIRANIFFENVRQAFDDLNKEQLRVLEVISDKESEKEMDFLDEPRSQLNKLKIEMASKLQREEKIQIIQKKIQAPEKQQTKSFDPKDHVKIFSGGNVALYKHFREEWNFADKNLTYLGKSQAEKFDALLEVLRGEALDHIKGFPSTNESYKNALEKLDFLYEKNCLTHQTILDELFGISKIQHQKPALMDFIAKVKSNLKSMESLKLDNCWDSLILMYVINSKLSEPLKKQFEKVLLKKNQLGQTPNVKDLLELLDNEVKNWNDQTKLAKDKQIHLTIPKQIIQKGSVNKGKKKECHLCNVMGEHWPTKCPTIEGKRPREIFVIVSSNDLCKICFNKGHFTKNCPSGWKCSKCNKEHHTRLHFN